MPAIFIVAFIHRRQKNVRQRIRHGESRLEGAHQARNKRFHRNATRRQERVHDIGRHLVFTGSEYLQLVNSVKQGAVFALCRLDSQKRNLEVTPELQQHSEGEICLAGARHSHDEAMLGKIVQRYARMRSVPFLGAAGVEDAPQFEVSLADDALVQLFAVAGKFFAFQTDSVAIVNRKLENAAELTRGHQIFQTEKIKRSNRKIPEHAIALLENKKIADRPRLLFQLFVRS